MNDDLFPNLSMIRAISLWQPWASAIALGLKTVETRSWATKYRGPVAIHAAETRQGLEFLDNPNARPYFVAVGMTDSDKLPYGCIVAVARLIVCQRTEEMFRIVTPKERIFGDYSPRRFGWVLSDIEPLKTPVPYVGRQGFFSVRRAELGV